MEGIQLNFWLASNHIFYTRLAAQSDCAHQSHLRACRRAGFLLPLSTTTTGGCTLLTCFVCF